MKLEKLKNASLDELRVRAAQKIAAFSERQGWSKLVKLPSDEVLFGQRDGREAAFFAGLESPQATAAALKLRWPETAQRLIEKADRICEGRFDLLGFKDLNFGDPIDWHFEPISGKRIPLVHWSQLDYLDAGVAGDKKIIWELNRHQYFMTLGQAFAMTGDERYAGVFVKHLEAWMDANPPKLGINWASSLEVAFRSMSWLWAFRFFKSSTSLSNDTLQRALKFLYLNGRHLESYLSTYFSPNTHLTGEALGLFYIGTLLPEFKDAKRWQKLGSSILIEQLPVHVRPDGVYFEQSSYYHRYTTDFYIHFLLLSRANNLPLPPDVERYLLLLLDHLMYITRPDGTTPLFGDDDGGRLAMLDVRPANDFRGTLGAGAVLFERGDYKFVADIAAEELLWLTGVKGLAKFDSIEAHEPSETSKAFLDGGYFVLRDGWTREANYLLFDCGPHGSLACGHAHADALAVDVAANGRTTLVDPGTYTYTGSKELRDWFRGSQSHNTLTLDQLPSSLPAGPFSWSSQAKCTLRKWISNDRFDFVSGSHDGYASRYLSATIARDIFFVKGSYWIISDDLIALEAHRAFVQFHFHPSARPLAGSDVCDTESGFTIKCFGDEGSWLEEEASVSHCYGHKEPSKLCIFSGLFRDPEQLITFLLPGKGEIRWNVTQIPAQDGKVFAVSGGKTLDLVIIRAERFEWLWLRFVDEQLQEVVAPLNDAEQTVDLSDPYFSELMSGVKKHVRH